MQWGLQSVVVCHSRSSQSGSVYCTMQRTCQGHFLSCSPWKYLAAACQHKPADPRLNNSRRHSHTAHRMHISEHAHKYTIPVTVFQLGLFSFRIHFSRAKTPPATLLAVNSLRTHNGEVPVASRSSGSKGSKALPKAELTLSFETAKLI